MAINLQRVSGVVSKPVGALTVFGLFCILIAFLSVQTCQGKDQRREIGPQDPWWRNLN